jgi:hypothetical protein
MSAEVKPNARNPIQYDNIFKRFEVVKIQTDPSEREYAQSKSYA